jgi:hypothetical protein
MDSAAKRPWYRLHLATWVVIGVVAYALAALQMEPQLGISEDETGLYMETRFGWPAAHLTTIDGRPSPTWLGPKPTFTPGWRYLPLALNLIVGLLLTALTAHALEIWLRRPNRRQLTLTSLLGITGVLAVLAGLVSGRISFTIPLLNVSSDELMSWDDLSEPLRWPVAVAMGCTLYSLGWLTLRILRRAYSAVRR